MWIFGWKGPSGFSARSTAEEVTHGIDASGITAIVTGASSGIGIETTRVLALRGAHVIMAMRNMGAGREVKEAIMKELPSAQIDTMELDLSSMASVRKFASDYVSSGLPLNLLVNNAGIFGTPFMLSQEGIELHIATNHSGHFLLTNLLLETMKRTSSRSNKEGRIVNLTSEAHRLVYHDGIRFDKINDESGYNFVLAYGQSKLANILHAKGLARLLKGAATTCYVALHPRVAGVSGEYFADSNIGKPSNLARDANLAKKLWNFSINLTGIQVDQTPDLG
ncbi:short-chain dehydrogenase TIC 32, chloroplastic-like isoform X3 [Punica granatum]|uniref:Short-chain dehydrogenase TIC 32, chloroplastic-like isoform X3 n=2 Tax=Punica granatum TaxID=22663 RepID=A0A6P8CBI0_PUNGR|nr:short-chain dehydrogenase TIC 32, chloroplastic-like isoform X3 [Punica granatum]PKI54006.1 hypothetical protein CRG98_025617 [Punica granatum]